MKNPVQPKAKAAWALLMATFLVLSLVVPSFAAQPDLKILAIEIQGNKSVASDVLLNAVKTKIGDSIAQDKLEEKIKDDLKGLYETGLIADQVAKFAPEKDGIKVIFEVVENPKVTGIAFQGNTMVPAQELVPLISIKSGAVLNTRSLQDDLDKVVKYYADKGGSIRIADVSSDKDGKLIIKVVERKIEKIVITGNVKTKNYVIKRELSSKEGQLIDFNKIRAEQRRIFNLGFFDEITPKLDEGKSQDDIVYTIALKEKRTGTASGGLGYSAADGMLGYVEVSEANLFGNGQTLNTRLEMGTKGSRTYELGFYEPWLDANRTSLGLNLYNKATPLKSEDKTYDYVEKRTGGDISIGRPLDLDSRLSLKFKIENSHSSRSEYPDFSLPGDGSTRSVTLGYTRDTRDNFFNPTRGYQVGGSVEVAGGILGGDNQFTKYESHASTYIKAFKNQTIALRVTGGHLAYSTAERPEQETFRLGGPDTIRGLDYGDLTGDTMAYANVEYRFPLTKILSGALFLDTGNTWNAKRGEKPDGLKTGTGLGIRVDTPLGLIRLDYGLTKASTGNVVGKTYFSIGQTF